MATVILTKVVTTLLLFRLIQSSVVNAIQIINQSIYNDININMTSKIWASIVPYNYNSVAVYSVGKLTVVII